MKHINKEEFGFTLVELAVTTLILGLVAIGISTLFGNIHQAQLQTRYLESATYAAQSQIEALRNINYNNLEPGQVIDFSNELPDDLPSSSIAIATISEPINDLRRIDVEIVYPVQNSTRTVRVSSLIGILGITQ